MSFQDQLGTPDSSFGNIEFGIGALSGGSVNFDAVVAEATVSAPSSLITGGAVFSAITATSTAAGVSTALTGGASFFASPAHSTYTAPSSAIVAGAILSAIPAESTFTAIPNILTDSWFSAATAQARAYAPGPGSSDGTAGFYPADYGELP